MDKNVCNLIDNLTRHNSRAYGYELSRDEILQILKLFDDVKELEQYRAIGTPTQIYEKIGGLDVELGKYHSIGTVEDWQKLIKKEATERRKLEEYFMLGSVEEFKALKKKNEPRELYGNEWNPVHTGDTVNGLCPVCMESFVCITPRMYKANNYGYCKSCGQKLDWGE